MLPRQNANHCLGSAIAVNENAATNVVTAYGNSVQQIQTMHAEHAVNRDEFGIEGSLSHSGILLVTLKWKCAKAPYS